MLVVLRGFSSCMILWFYCGFGLHAAFGLWVYVGLVVFRVMILLLFGDLLFWVCAKRIVVVVGLWWVFDCGFVCCLGVCFGFCLL